MASYNYSGVHAAAQNENSVALLSSGGTAARSHNDDGAAYLYYPGARDATRNNDGAAYQYHYFGVPTTEGQDEHGAAYAFISGARTAMTLIDGGAANLFPEARTAAPTKNGASYVFSDVHVPTAAQTKEDDAACFYPSMHAVIFSGVRAAGRGEMLPYQTQTTAAAVKTPAAGYYNSGVVAGEALPLTSKVFGGKTTSVPAVAINDKVAGRLRRELPGLGLSLASLTVALAAGEPTPAAGFGLFLMLIVGLSTVTMRALRD